MVINVNFRGASVADIASARISSRIRSGFLDPGSGVMQQRVHRPGRSQPAAHRPPAHHKGGKIARLFAT